MLSEYLKSAMGLAKTEKMEDGRYFGTIPGFEGLWADGATKKQCISELRKSLEEWLVIALREDDELPEISGGSLNFGGKRWKIPLPDENRSGGSEGSVLRGHSLAATTSSCAEVE